MKLSSKISLAFFPGVVLATVGIVFFAHPVLESVLRKPLSDNKALQAEQVMGAIDRLFNERYNDIQVISKEEDFLKQLENTGAKWDRAAEDKLDSLLELTGPWDALMVVDRAGTIRLSSAENFRGKGVEQNEEEVRALRRALDGFVYYSDLVLSKRLGRPTVLFAAPIIKSNERNRPIVGAVMGYYSWPVILELLAESEGASYLRLYNGAGDLIGSGADKDRAHILSRNDGAQPGLRQALEGKSEAAILRPQGGVGQIFAVHALQQGYLNYKGNGWVLSVQTPIELAFASIRVFLRKLMAVLFLFIGLSFLAVIGIIMMSVSRPLGEFNAKVLRIAGGDLSKQIELPSSSSTLNEIEELAASFNSMLRNLQETTVSKEALLASEEKLLLFRSLMERSDDSIFIADPPSGRFLDVNEKACSSLGYAKGELLGMAVYDICPDFTQEYTWEAVERDIRQRGSALIASRHRRKDGAVFPVEVNATYISLREKNYILAVVRDVSERKRMELRMIQSEKLSAVGQLAAGVAHEINNPLGIILGFAQSAARKINGSDALSLPIKSIEREALRCKNLVQNLLAFSRQGNARMERCDLNETLESTLSIVEAQARVKSVEIVRELGDLEPVLCEKNQLQQVIVNLCNNAMDAMPGGGKIIVRTRQEGSGEAGRVVLEISDTGTGIPKEIQDKIFNPFFTTKEVGKGTGLGLSLVYEIVHRHQGTIDVDSTVGRGTTFFVSLPGHSIGSNRPSLR